MTPKDKREGPQKLRTAGQPRRGRRKAGSHRVHCRFATSSAPRFTQEFISVLRSRLRLAILIFLVGFSFYILRGLWLHGLAFGNTPVRYIAADCEMVLLIIVSALLWSRRALSMASLRGIELTVFALLAAFCCWTQMDNYSKGAMLNDLAPGHQAMVYRLVGTSTAFGWSLLIVVYGTLIPNTWRRCALVVGAMAVLPVAFLVVNSQLRPHSGTQVLAALPEMILLIATAAIIAVYGSHRIRELQKKAHEARQIGQYRLKEVLGIGGMGTVYLAEHILLSRPCAIKLIRADRTVDHRTLQRFEREVQVTATLTHWNTIEIYDFGRAEDGTFYYVMEYLPGMNLDEIVECHGPLPPERTVHLLRQVCQALREAHDIGFVHRDIKPSNIFACERGGVQDVAKLLDFGLVQTLDAKVDGVKLTREGAFAGSPAFMSPEQAQGQLQLDARSDIYSLGAVAVYLLTGNLLFDRQSAVDMLHAHAHDPFVPSPELKASASPDLQRVIVRCLEKDPNRRYQDAQSLEIALAKCEGLGEWSTTRARQWWQGKVGCKATPSRLEAGKRNISTMLIAPA
jgi:tRNA A-37 threonylcarbamoyl transferase component Bud32